MEFEVTAHGNRKSVSNPSFYPTKKSVLQAMQEGSGQCCVNDALKGNVGGICGARAPSDLPRSRQQIYNVKSRMNKLDSYDDVADLLKYAWDKEDLVLHHSDYQAIDLMQNER